MASETGRKCGRENSPEIFYSVPASFDIGAN